MKAQVVNKCYTVEAIAVPGLPRLEKREIRERLRESKLNGAKRFPYNERGKSRAEAMAETLRARAAEAGFADGEVYIYNGESFGLTL